MFDAHGKHADSQVAAYDLAVEFTRRTVEEAKPDPAKKSATWLTASYSLYLWHLPVLVAFGIGGGDVHDRTLALPAVIVSVAVAWLSYRYVERPFLRTRRLTRRIAAERRSPSSSPVARR